MANISSDPSYSYVNEQNVDEELKCPICFEPLVSPVVCQNCRNTFCRGCVESLNQCPLCVGHLRPLQEPPRLLTSLLGKLTVKCNVCSKVVKRGDFINHSDSECPVPCVWGCEEILTRSALCSHNETCPRIEVSCHANDVGCSFKAYRTVIDAHLSTCPFLALRSLLLTQQTRIQQLEAQIKQLEQPSSNQRLRLPLTIKFKSHHEPPPSSKPKKKETKIF